MLVTASMDRWLEIPTHRTITTTASSWQTYQLSDQMTGINEDTPVIIQLSFRALEPGELVI